MQIDSASKKLRIAKFTNQTDVDKHLNFHVTECSILSCICRHL